MSVGFHIVKSILNSVLKRLRVSPGFPIVSGGGLVNRFADPAFQTIVNPWEVDVSQWKISSAL